MFAAPQIKQALLVKAGTLAATIVVATKGVFLVSRLSMEQDFTPTLATMTTIMEITKKDTNHKVSRAATWSMQIELRLWAGQTCFSQMRGSTPFGLLSMAYSCVPFAANQIVCQSVSYALVAARCSQSSLFSA